MKITHIAGMWPGEIGAGLAVASLLASWLVITGPSAQGQTQTPTFSVLHSFQCTGGDGTSPMAGVIRDSAGNLYGTTISGGFFLGTVFEISASGQETLLHEFGHDVRDGTAPEGSLLRDPGGNLYGTTNLGGSNTTSCPTGCGTVFKLTPAGKEILLHTFTGFPDGSNPFGSLVKDSNGNLYGTTSLGGANLIGTVFELTRTGVETVLYNFPAYPSDAAGPQAGLLRDSAGNLYGTTVGGGTFGFGTVFELTPAGVETVLHSFQFSATDGGEPMEGLVRDSAGNLYGSTPVGGAFNNGTIFKLDPTGAETILFNFDGGNQGGAPVGVIQDAKGNLFGAAAGGGDLLCPRAPAGCGVLFELNSASQYTVLHTFTGAPDGAFPVGSLLLDSAGNLYGVTTQGGTGGGIDNTGCGTVFKITH